MKQHLYRFLTRLGFPYVMSRLHRGKAVIVMYHGFTDRHDHEVVGDLHLHIDVFREHLRYLKRHYNVVSLDRLLDYYVGGPALPPNSVVITMDDGYRSNYEFAFPLLQEFNCPATIFLATRFVDDKQLQWTDRLEYAVLHASPDILREAVEDDSGDADSESWRARILMEAKHEFKSFPQEQRADAVDEMERRLGCSLAAAVAVPALYQPLEWAEVQEMLDSGLVLIGSHTASHYIVSRCTSEVMREELVSAKALIEERTGVPCPLFCYPNGGRGDFDERSREVLEEIGHTCALTTIEGFNDEQSDVYELRRIGWFGQSPEEFVMAVTGIAGWINKCRAGMRRVGIRY